MPDMIASLEIQKKSKRSISPIYLEEEKIKTVNRSDSAKSRKKLIAFGWYGGKFSHLDWILPMLPECHHYCEPFSGSAAVLLNRSPSPVETYNDIDGEVTEFFRVLRDDAESLMRSLALTPFSREEYYKAIYTPSENLNAVERARRFYIKARQTRTGLAQTASLGRWANCKNTTRAGMSGVVSRWLGGIEALDAIAERLLRVQIENRPALDILKLYDDPQTLFYCDPPYLHETRGDSKAYGFEMDEEQHRILAEALNACTARIAVSGYDHPLMEQFYPASKWFKTEGPEKTIHSTKGTRREILWTNYNPHDLKAKSFLLL